MTLIKRIGYYLVGFSIGLIFLAFFLKKKKAEFCYGIDCRVIKNIQSKNIKYSEEANAFMYSLSLDSATFATILKRGDVNISKSNTKLDSCKVYFIESEFEERKLSFTIENCEKTATVQAIKEE
ncbi:MAG: hypothetical protein KJP09_08630 [Bacteroidia bacterium]|nr:hypothetical protein [Bacteroidia bacterium]NND10535.1 hypothetical protein [Flavobacteriaceae bacterium]NNK28751.1 hypothetical protein [Flavobacteriaceae bacterium]